MDSSCTVAKGKAVGVDVRVEVDNERHSRLGNSWKLERRFRLQPHHCTRCIDLHFLIDIEFPHSTHPPHSFFHCPSLLLPGAMTFAAQRRKVQDHLMGDESRNLA